MKIKLVLILALTLKLKSSQGQELLKSVRGLSWHASSVELQGESKIVPYTGQWIIHDEYIDWIQPKEKYNYRFNLRRIEGEWDSLRNTGRFSAEIQFRNKIGNAEFVSEKGRIQIQFFISSELGQLFPYRFNISSIEK